ncbi:MAG TPA: helix-turn-helix transcriptional regulator [Xanthobacteraceae bacterium]|nr:helix-turn-helix transcriptional regulator [Xanthobacteraceae bacterium]
MSADVRMAEVAALIGDPARANILAALMGGQALTAGELVYAAGVSPQTTSGHLARLTDGFLIACVKQGRHRYYRIATPRVAEMLEGIMAVVADAPPRHRPLSKIDEAMRNARTCYDHVAGKLGVGMTDALCALGHVTLSGDGGEVNESGVTFFQKLGVDLQSARSRRRIFCRPCLDMTERRPHLGGSIGAALAQRCFDLGWIERMRDGRALAVTASGRRGLSETFGLSLERAESPVT